MSIEQFSLLELFQRGGPIMWVLLLISAVGMVIFVERALFLHRGHIRSTEFLEGIKNIVQKRRLVEALTVAEETPGPVANLVKAGLLHHEDGEEKIRFAIQEAALVEIPALERRIGSIGAIAHIAPLLGLLGTVLGMIETFYQFEQAGVYAKSAALSERALAGHADHRGRAGCFHRGSSGASFSRRDGCGHWSMIWSGSAVTWSRFWSVIRRRRRRFPRGRRAVVKARPFDFEAHLHPKSRRMDPVPFIDACLIVIFFSLFGSSYVFAPGITLHLPHSRTAAADALPVYEVLTVGEIEGAERILYRWSDLQSGDLRVRACSVRDRSGARPPCSSGWARTCRCGTLSQVCDIARAAGFREIQIAAEPETEGRIGFLRWGRC